MLLLYKHTECVSIISVYERIRTDSILMQFKIFCKVTDIPQIPCEKAKFFFWLNDSNIKEFVDL